MPPAASLFQSHDNSEFLPRIRPSRLGPPAADGDYDFDAAPQHQNHNSDSLLPKTRPSRPERTAMIIVTPRHNIKIRIATPSSRPGPPAADVYYDVDTAPPHQNQNSDSLPPRPGQTGAKEKRQQQQQQQQQLQQQQQQQKSTGIPFSPMLNGSLPPAITTLLMR